jgi:hypothetical protein
LKTFSNTYAISLNWRFSIFANNDSRQDRLSCAKG